MQSGRSAAHLKDLSWRSPLGLGMLSSTPLGARAELEKLEAKAPLFTEPFAESQNPVRCIRFRYDRSYLDVDMLTFQKECRAWPTSSGKTF